MTSIKPFQIEDLFEVNAVNLDPLTENFNVSFYQQYLTEWPDLFFKSTEIYAGTTPEISGYMMAKTEGSLSKKEWHTHITAVSVQDTYRRLGLASQLCKQLERLTSVDAYNTLFVDLFVKVTNKQARQLYEGLGYSVYRRVIGYYGKEMPTDRTVINDLVDGFDMRKSLPRDVHNETVRENGDKVCVLPNEVVF
ncbi:N-terminal acetyltransferase [Suhomyces tanzawaensis NRRL Y-17324]|uniref:N-terminal acetyltransferase n=1 Tax=Suhomyces tanzawaensis NRRL Y-17324 TaxID=984487 RepID=A0A1E4SGG4_9ASCO|nr:N-terminal acetyltransferase [Suhomyces tanzawaensis NRRL Y-17324]ODV78609.1 N-terminal acetyltransferase [Suhomyces tanzawaensis NRRL Y-17324]